MARLINDSGVLGDAITITADTVKQVPFNKIIEAIHVVQTEMDITGTTAEEASTTISGSFATFKATWTNLLAGLTDEDADMKVLFGNLTGAGETLLNNLLALLPSFKENLAVLMAEAGQYIHNHVRDTLWPKVKEAIDVSWLVENIGIPVENFRTNVIEPIAGQWNDTVAPAIGSAITEVDNFLGLGLVDGWNSITTAAKLSWDNVTSSIVKTTEAVKTFLALGGNTGLGGGDARPWYVREHTERFTNQVADGSRASGGAGKVSIEHTAVTKNAEGAIFGKPTIFGTRLGYQMVGEAGPEAVAPIDKLQQYVSDAVKSTVGGMQFNIVLDSGVLVGQLAPQMDVRLGTLANRKGRG